MSFSATGLMIAVFRCAGSSAVTSARAVSSSTPRVRCPFCGPSLTSAGFAPANEGVLEIAVPFTTEKCSEM